MSRDTVNVYHRDPYRPENLVVAAAGNLDHDHVVEMVRDFFARDGFLDGEATPSAPRAAAAPDVNFGHVRIHPRDTEQANIVWGMPGISRNDERRFIVSVLNASLGGGMSSRLFQEIREKRGLAYSVYSYAQQFAGAGIFSVYAGCQPKRVHEVLQIARDVIGDVAANGLTDEEVMRGKGQVRGGLVLGLEDTGSRMSRLGKAELVFGDTMSVDEIIEHIDAVTVDDVRRVAGELLAQPSTLAVVGPFEDAEPFRQAVGA
jgi:predicted Zn-dependent peptidase